jgi:hypothetical protein
MDKVKAAWELFNSLVSQGFELYKVVDASKSFPKLNEIREISANIPLYVALVEETSFDCQNKLFKSIILTEEILLGYLNQNTPLIKLPRYKTLLVALPVWIYLNENFLIEYSYKRGALKNTEIEKLVKYANATSIPENIKGQFINTIIKLLAPYNTQSIFDVIDTLDSLERNTTVIKLSDELKRFFEEKFRSKS